jgi:DNA-binding NarL/FixJ family response regulator
MNRPRVLLADDHTLLLEAFRKLLEPECDVVGTATDGRAVLDMAERLKPDVVVMDIAMPLLNGLDAGQQLKQLMPDVEIIFLTVNEDPDFAAEAFRVGASGYVLKGSAASELFQAIREVLQGKTYLTPLVSADGVLASQRRSGRGLSSRQLTSRQREVLQLLAEGHSMKEAAEILNVRPRTVAYHKYRIMNELGVETNAELVQYAVKSGIVSV